MTPSEYAVRVNGIKFGMQEIKYALKNNARNNSLAFTVIVTVTKFRNLENAASNLHL